jgi:hypothetical protein
MPVPNLLHPVKITLQRRNVTDTLFDEDMREPIGQTSYYAEETLMGQVSWENKDNVYVDEKGTQLKAIGYVLFRYVDLESAGIVLKYQDRIKKIGKHEEELYIIKTKPMGHYPNQDGASLIRAYFVDRISMEA